jgi:hypothetical protein
MRLSSVYNEPPVAAAGPDRRVIVNENVKFDGTGSHDADGHITRYEWAFGDDASGVGAIAYHTYTTPAIRTVFLKATDDNGATGLDSATVWVITSVDAVDELILVIQGYELPQGTASSLVKILGDAKRLIAKDKITAAKDKLNAFITRVEAERGKTLTGEQADAFISAANRILATL